MKPFFSDEFIDQIDGSPIDNYFSPVLDEVFSLIPTPQTICDIGCGNGVFTIDLKRRLKGCNLTGVDGSAYALQQAQNVGFDELHLVNDFSADILPLKDNSFDLVICKDVLEHLLHPEQLVSEISRVLKEEGKALIHVPNHFTLLGRVRLLMTNNIDPFDYFPNAKRWEFPHIRFYNHASMVELLKMHNLNVAYELCHHFIQIPLGRFLPRSLRKSIAGRWPDAFSEGLTFLVTKIGAQ